MIDITKCPLTLILKHNSNGFAMHEERDTLWCLLWSTVNLIMSQYWTCMWSRGYFQIIPWINSLTLTREQELGNHFVTMWFVILQAIQDKNDVKLKRREDGTCISLLLKPEVISFILATILQLVTRSILHWKKQIITLFARNK